MPASRWTAGRSVGAPLAPSRVTASYALRSRRPRRPRAACRCVSARVTEHRQGTREDRRCAMVRRDRAAGRAPGAGRRASTRPARTTTAGGADLAAHKIRLREVIEPIVEAAGYELEELSVSRAGR